MILNGVAIDDEFAEAFGMKATRVIITAQNLAWAYHAANAATGFATSVIACGCEAGVERELTPAETPDGRPGVAILLFAMSGKELAKQLERRIGQCVLTSPTSAAFAGLEGGDPVALGKNLRFFGDGFQASKQIAGKRYWRVPVMDGEFLVEETTGVVPAVGGGNFLVLAESQPQALAACEAAIAAMRTVPNVIMPFPGGVVRSGSKVGSRYKSLGASTNDAFCPTIRGITKSQLSPEIGSVMEIVIDGLTADDISASMKAGIRAVTALGRAQGIHRISAGNYGGKLGKYHFKLREILAS
ncbi:MAG: formylmethanofuran--tetrahydromethanopterin N-formyltransferase [Gemmatimonadetes bacterium]|nr:formylmethanofuran--tetrahydromethanopterin N-formyltransferase [Gemmatimonadota bacterium]MBK6781814.1 formylmethanofuran--tetrahydromethanopterin N-formyltransferase [Gemmatimonadota bacterium]MBK7925810.1 formylmethanofuran--tetrahydromethanopterin N-formyltransferase [Gemmatimonadota bacterium]MBK9691825.1 formylmethanofuran--tetrahydromethanopterin N-formyltransferase [Gemmatimonadota bacterium]